MNKNVLFYSNFCSYSKAVVNQINKQNVRDDFLFVCVDGQVQVPAFVDRVPAILTVGKQLLVDEAVDQFVASKAPTSVEDVFPCAISDIQSNRVGFSDSFSFIDSSSASSANPNYGSVSMLDPQHTQHTQQQLFQESTKDKNKPDASAIIEQLKSQREKDMRDIMGSRKPVY